VSPEPEAPHAGAGRQGANIVFEDAPIDEMIEGIIDGIFFNQGHVCCAGSRLLVQESVADEVLAPTRASRRAIAGGRPDGQEHRRGPINSAATPSRMTSFGESEGATRYTSSCTLPEKGYCVRAHGLCQCRSVPPDRARGDLGPVLSVLTFRTPEEAIVKAHTELRTRLWGVEREGQSHLVGRSTPACRCHWANTYNKFEQHSSPFGECESQGSVVRVVVTDWSVPRCLMSD